jgi:8-oxo-dGTP pyrophosphatase MutT (NUDIX family)
MIYWARPKVGSARRADRTPQRDVPTKPTLAGEEHHDIRWCSIADLETLQPAMSNAVKWYCRKALEEIKS